MIRSVSSVLCYVLLPVRRMKALRSRARMEDHRRADPKRERTFFEGRQPKVVLDTDRATGYSRAPKRRCPPGTGQEKIR